MEATWRADRATDLGSRIDRTKSEELSSRQAALVAGVGLFSMAVVAPVANFVFIQKLVVANDAAATVRKIALSDATFRVGIVGLLLVVVLDVIVAWALHVFLRRANPSLSLLAANMPA